MRSDRARLYAFANAGVVLTSFAVIVASEASQYPSYAWLIRAAGVLLFFWFCVDARRRRSRRVYEAGQEPGRKRDLWVPISPLVAAGVVSRSPQLVLRVIGLMLLAISFPLMIWSFARLLVYRSDENIK
jgi:hypothetical protein